MLCVNNFLKVITPQRSQFDPATSEWSLVRDWIGLYRYSLLFSKCKLELELYGVASTIDLTITTDLTTSIDLMTTICAIFSLLFTKCKLEMELYGVESALQTCRTMLLLWKSLYEVTTDWSVFLDIFVHLL